MKMTWFQPRGPKLTLDQQERLAALKQPAPIGPVALTKQRMVVLDLETTGLHLKRDLVISIGAVVIENGAIDFSQQFECTLNRQVKVTESVLIHGIAPSELARGLPPAEALLSFMEFAGDSVILAFHAPFDQRMLARALKKDLGFTLKNAFLDVADLAPMLFSHAMIHRGGLDHWLDYFHIDIPQRHHAAADAMATAQIALILMNRARRLGLESMDDLAHRLRCWQRSRKAALHSF
ncbi:3'-5' exonuclease [Pseudomonas sp. S5(2021)]|jgi:DNA polymerase-3 subunit epsilon|uniref:3'-5' exonuclease n=1 Tax=Stutzerimonas balearica TaxID=74829 RepID=A0A9X7YPY9_9GAMM|nr:3'-5' exonuclease [Stutzerimonas balearica]MBZ5757462.1 3'-5' exonuclease [Pseudomonas sp. S5(2021)]HAV88648.1 3'-5' exonuclease [Pseudomonas sp.]OMG65146.1 DNA polymerase III subunit epsilon [Stutzerimonas balearica]QQN49763.1 3'-5' exonuclease [Stutzerimonas balearica]WAN09445.1 3'-5' exonuclease [Stutzerimonas balearica]